MTAIPVRGDNKEVVANLYGNADYFALYDEKDDSFEIVKNDAKGDGLKTGEFVVHNGATNTLYINLGEGIFNYLIDQDINIFYVGKEELALKDVIKLFKERRLTRVTKYNAKQYLNSGNCTCNKK